MMRTDRSETTPRMRVLELADPERRDIRRIIAESFARTHSFAETARELGTTKGGLKNWLDRLGGHLEMEKRIVFGTSGETTEEGR